MTEYTGLKGNAAADENFNMSENLEGSGGDLVTYEIANGGARHPLTVKVELLYQSSSPRFLENFFTDDTPAVSQLKQMYQDSDNPPIIVDSAVLDWSN